MSEYEKLINYDDYDYEIEEREKHIQNIHQDIQDMHGIFHTLNQLTLEQGFLINHIEDNIQDVVINVENAEVQLVEASKKQKKNNQCLWIILSILIIIFLIIVLLLLFLH